jgi:hypothetical protein
LLFTLYLHVQSLILPLLIALILYLVLFHAILPLYRQHRARYAEYLPVSFNSSSPDAILPSSYNTLRTRLAEALVAFILTISTIIPSSSTSWARQRGGVSARGNVDDDLDSDGDEELEEGVWDGRDGESDRALGRAMRGRGRGRPTIERHEETPRLSRDLEEGFRDSSGDEDSDDES